MPQIAFDQLPDHARLWVFAASRPLSGAEQARLLDQVDAFQRSWAAHGTPLTSGRALRYDRFLLIGVDERAAGVSGCSIDALARGLRTLEQELGVELLNNAPVLYREGESIRRLSRPEFHRLASAGQVTPETLVFDNTVATVGGVRSGRWEGPAGNAWHGRVFFGEVRKDA